MDMRKELSRLLYAFMAFYVKTQMKGTLPPKFSSLLPLLDTMCTEIQDLVNEVDEDWENEFILKDDFVENMDVYLKKVARKRLKIEDTPPPSEPEEVDGDDNGDGNEDGNEDGDPDGNGNEDENEDGDVVEEEEAPSSVPEESPSPPPEMTPSAQTPPEQTPETQPYEPSKTVSTR